MTALVTLLALGTVGVEAPHLKVDRPGWVHCGRPLPVGTTRLQVVGPQGGVGPVQWQWIEPGPHAGATRRWARLCFFGRRRGWYRLRSPAGVKPEAPPAVVLRVEPSIRIRGREWAGERRVRWSGPLCAEGVASGWGPPGLALHWRVIAQAHADGLHRLTVELCCHRAGTHTLPPVGIPLPVRAGRVLGLEDTDRVDRGTWWVRPPRGRLAGGQVHRARLLLHANPSRRTPIHWTDHPGGRPGELCRLCLPGGPPKLVPSHRTGRTTEERALSDRLARAVHRLERNPGQDRGDLQDREGRWINLEFDLPWALTLHHLRTGGSTWLAGALTGVDHMTGTDLAGAALPGCVAGLPLVHGPRHRTQGTETGHIWIQGLLAGGLLSGNPDRVAAARRAVHALAVSLQDRGTAELSRCLGWPGVALRTWCELTPDPLARWALRRLAARCGKAWDGEGGCFVLAGESPTPGVRIAPLWVQSGLLLNLALLGEPLAPWHHRGPELLVRAGVTGPASLTLVAGRPARVGRPAPLPWLGLALEGTAEVCRESGAWRRAARRFLRGFKRELRRCDARGLTLLARAWPVVVGG